MGSSLAKSFFIPRTSNPTSPASSRGLWKGCRHASSAPPLTLHSLGVPSFSAFQNLLWGLYLYLTDHSDARFSLGAIASLIVIFALLSAFYRYKPTKPIEPSKEQSASGL